MSTRVEQGLCCSEADGAGGHCEVQAGDPRGEREEDPEQNQAPLHSEDDQLQHRHQVPLLCVTIHTRRGTILSSQSFRKIQESILNN